MRVCMRVSRENGLPAGYFIYNELEEVILFGYNK